MFACKAQGPIISITDKSQPNVLNAYYKDVDGIMNKFEGTWIYQNGNTSLTIKLEKKEAYFNNRYYRDRLVGEYKYTVDGVDVVNYLPRFNDSNVNDSQRSIKGSRSVLKNYMPSCTDCSDTERLFSLYFRDFERNYLRSRIVIRHKTDNNVEKLKILIEDHDSAMLPTDDSPTITRVPYGTYELIKQ